ncbi:hypothetical protein [Streptomyces sp. PA5.6]|uniref:hypothetical protein n=1 Tax=Streptomyces sp. PA5.6 TaxID=3035651 RepID=UPI003904A514
MLIMNFGSHVSHRSSEQVAEEVEAWDDGDGEIISDQCAQTIASWWQSPGSDGIHFAVLSTSGKVPFGLAEDCEREAENHNADKCPGEEEDGVDCVQSLKALKAYVEYIQTSGPKGAAACLCCGQDVVGRWLCEGCTHDYPGDEDECNAKTAWHCFTGHCDGSGCTYPGECEEDDGTFREYYAFDRVKIVEESHTAPGLGGTVTVGQASSGEVIVKPDGWNHTVNLSPIYVEPTEGSVVEEAGHVADRP